MTNKIITFRGNKTRNKEINNILKSLGGIDTGYLCTRPNSFYYVDKYNNIVGTDDLTNPENHIVYTIEEYLDKNKPSPIVNTNGENNITITTNKWSITIDKNTGDVINKIITPIFPSTYQECLNVLGLPSDFEPTTGLPDNMDLNNMTILNKLIICRNAYWKIIGEQMNLNEPWDPKKYNKQIYFINPSSYWVRRDNTHNNKNYSLFSFPSQEIRDHFYFNFKKQLKNIGKFISSLY